MNSFTRNSAIAATALLSTPALAHSAAGEHHSLLSGMLHTLTGLDHLLAMLLFGLIAGSLTAKKGAALLGAVALALVAGFSAGLSIKATGGEAMVLASLALLPFTALALHRGVKVVQLLAVAAILMFSTAHGWVIGGEASGSLLQFGLGVTLSSLLVAGGCAVVVNQVVGARNLNGVVAER